MLRQILLGVWMVGAMTGISGHPQNIAKSDGSALVGDWRGDSICQVRPSACNDEKALYRFKKLDDQPNRLSLEADKIVNGEAVQMGAPVECSFAPEKHALTCSTPKFTVQLTLNGKNLNGTMNLPDGTLWRKITLQHD